tara:strand:- start:23 stop:241 length:219 start_codon:yes stop_codon:yes gene_type:complete
MLNGVIVSQIEPGEINYISNEDKLYLEMIISQTNYNESSICELLGISIGQLNGEEPLSELDKKYISLLMKSL